MDNNSSNKSSKGTASDSSKTDLHRLINTADAAEMYIRVADDYYKKTNKPDKNGKLHPVLSKRSKTTITDDHRKSVISFIKKYDGFTTLPSHTDYQQVVHGYYNKYHEITHTPQKGDFLTVITFLTHLFSAQYLDFILDYIQILYLNPTQNLPIILLESEKRNTGKSTFGFFLEKIFQANVIGLGNKDLESEFNSVWLDKLLIIVDETQLKDESVGQMLKRLSTEKGEVLSNAKGKDKIGVEFIGKFIFMSNEEGKALPIARGENRFAVFKVPTLAESGLDDNPKQLDVLESEIPAFLHYLSTRKLVHESSGRMHFAPNSYHTDQLKIYFKGGASYVAKAIKELITHTFEMFWEEEEIKLSASELFTELTKGNYLKNTDRQQIKKALEGELNLTPQKRSRYIYFSAYQAEMDESGTYYPTASNKNLIHYIFKKSDYFEIADSLNSTNSSILEPEQMALFPILEHHLGQ